MEVIPNEQINNIRSSNDIVDVISSYLPLTQRGKNYFGVCPFHDDHSPSMSVSKEKQIYTCFSCGATGNVIKFVMDYENINFPEALKLLADRAGINIDIRLSKNNITTNKYKVLYEIYDLAAKFYQNNINTAVGLKAKEYLKQRNIDDNVIHEFDIGLAITNNNLLTQLLVRKNYNTSDMLKSGLIVKYKTNYMDIFYNRVMFPLYDLNGQVVGFSGRIYDSDDSSKYINTKETEIFKKGELLYNYHRAKNSCRQKNTVIVMEGFMDVIRAYTIGVDNVVATMGTAVTKNQASLIKKMARDVIFCFDGDQAGAKATMSCCELFSELGITPKVVRLDNGLDPDEYIQKFGKEKFMAKINHPISMIDFKLDYLKQGKDFNNPNDVANYVNKVIDDLNVITDDVLREITLKKISNESGLDIDFLRSKLTKIDHNVILPNFNPKNIKKKNKYQKAEQNLIFYMLKSTEVIRLYDKKITYMPDEVYRTLAREISYFYSKYGYINSADLISSLKDNASIEALGQIEMLDLKDNYSIEEINDYINTIWEYNLNFEINTLKEKIKKETDPIIKAKLAQKIVDLKVRGDAK
ncbi:MAG: DNA primase [Bacilli bacterium]